MIEAGASSGRDSGLKTARALGRCVRRNRDDLLLAGLFAVLVAALVPLLDTARGLPRAGRPTAVNASDAFGQAAPGTVRVSAGLLRLGGGLPIIAEAH